MEVFTIFVDSQFRDKAMYPSSGSYVIHLDNVLKGVASIELSHAMYPSVSGMKYANMWIDEAQSTLFSNASAKGAFTQLLMIEREEGAMNTYSGLTSFKTVKTFEQPLMKLSRLTIKFTTPSGDPCAIGEHLLRIDISCLRQKEWREARAFAPVTASSSAPLPEGGDPYMILGISTSSDWNTVYDAYKQRYRKVQRIEKQGASEDTTRARQMLKEALTTIAQRMKSGLSV